MLPDRERSHRPFGLLAVFLVSLSGYFLLMYHTPREEFAQLLLCYTVIFLAYLWVLSQLEDSWLPWALAAAVLLRISLLGALPALSDDFYRFLWDGRLWNQGINPFAILPSDLMKDPDFSGQPIHQVLYNGLNSPNYFTVYPPLAQAVFIAATKIFPDHITGGVVVIRLFILAAELGSIFLMVRLLRHYGWPVRNVLIYAWNPLVIVELTGNLHFEGIMIFFLLLAVYMFEKNRLTASAASMAAAVAAKLIPLIFLPLLWSRLSWKRMLTYWGLTAILVGLLFWPVVGWEPLRGVGSGLSLYFQKFEFNASIYYLIREAGYFFKGYNIIATSGKILAVFTLVLILLFAATGNRRISWPRAMLWTLGIYLLLSTTVHPWYITPLVALAIFTDMRFPLLWSFLVIVTYAGYTGAGYTENLWLVLTEYVLVLVTLMWDVKRANQSMGN